MSKEPQSPDDQPEVSEQRPLRAPVRESQLVSARLIADDGASSLIEWVQEGVYLRGTVPTSDLQATEQSDLVRVADSVLAKARPYGLAWESLIVLQATPEQIANELRRRGLWTAADLRANQSAALGAFQSPVAADLAALLNRLSEQE